LEAKTWDGRTKYAVQESQEEMEKRLNKWHSFIEGDSTAADGESKGQSQTSTKTPPSDAADSTSNSSPKSAVATEDSVVDNVKNSSDDGAGV